MLLKTPLEQMQDIEQGRLLPLLTGWRTEPYPLHVLLPSGRFVPARVRALVDFLAARCAAAAVQLSQLDATRAPS